ncbi:UDP-glucose--hexose-1-phosphate uridylyltransferase [Fictibacillus phosphorivorans]|uniref:UDP-glucose--hexose-1-phosphate uridylyltransferase n=1 Tax=Fictibacillus phosphorivorans TaxID=1221500 RepID=UPI00203CCDB3|nr:UDP-glucose--hexose-1-phosphate uridylyltransferase [Fictibacillus phosphorivorans]MCM3717746.1 UDP-glucose--hexose-1-phosphate uridylyltransferase [Fictibacillus phosphorivorans]MCM3775646.1 UDP-glucose--hexose-1-phosphate uridylyltransferase [Fictibacillus phosphorivorans]
MEIYSVIQKLIDKAVSLEMIQKQDEIYARNQVIALLGLKSFVEEVEPSNTGNIPDFLEQLVEYAVEKDLINNLLDEKEILSSKIMNSFMPRPSELNKSFYEKYKDNPEEATSFFYELSQNSNYIQTKRIAKNISYKADTPYGELDITINLSKPEKDPKEIELEKKMKVSSSNDYPNCLLCIENEGYEGRIGHPARSNHRLIHLNLKDEEWYLQYSPYVYYNEHCILLSGEHRDMKINQDTFERLLSFVEQFPHYFAGSNADLPIVGGSILSHDHYQGGRYDFAMAKAKDEFTFELNSFPSVRGATLEWPMSVIRLRGRDVAGLSEAATFILNKWISYSDSSVDIEAYSGDTRHNTITPIARYRNGEFEMDLVLRNNRISDLYPLGIFHPHQDVHHIKKENIGLIEVMGLAVLPSRLKNELEEIKSYLLAETDELIGYHLPWANDMKERYGKDITPDSVEGILKRELGIKFLRVLMDAGVFKRNKKGQDAFKRFIFTLQD